MSNPQHEEILLSGRDDKGALGGEVLDLADSKLEFLHFDGRKILAGAILRGALLKRTTFVGADLSGANLTGADLTWASLRGAELQGANLRDANLQGANLVEAKNLDSKYLQGAILAKARLPSDLPRFTNLAEAEKVAGFSHKGLLFWGVVLWLPLALVVSLGDARLLFDASIPYRGQAIPALMVAYCGPAAFLLWFLFAGVCYQKLWEQLAKLPAIFPDEIRLDQTSLLASRVTPYFSRLREEPPRFNRLQASTLAFLEYWLPPLTLAAVWLRCLRLHDASLTLVHEVVLIFSFILTFQFQGDAQATFQNFERRSGAPRRFIPWLRVAVLLTLSLGSAVLSMVAVVRTRASDAPLTALRPLTLDLAGANLAELAAADPAFSLRGRDFRGARAKAVFLEGLDLSSVDLSLADLREAKLAGAQLQRASLRHANLRDADLRGAHFAGADLTGARLDRAVLDGAELKGVRGLTWLQLRRAASWNQALLPRALRGAKPTP